MPAPRRTKPAATSRRHAIDALVSVAPPLTRWIERLLAAHDPPLTLAQYLALRAIARDGTDSSELARRAGVSGPAVSQVIATLSASGLIDRAAVEGDRRRHALELSADGARTLRSAEGLLRRRLGSLLEDVPPHEADALALLLGAVEATLEGRPPPRRPPPPGPPAPAQAPKRTGPATSPGARPR